MKGANKMVSKIGAKEFKNRVKTTLMKVDGNIKEDDRQNLQ